MKSRAFRGWPAQAALIPTWLIVLVIYIGTMLWTVQISFTSSRLLPVQSRTDSNSEDSIIFLRRAAA